MLPGGLQSSFSSNIPLPRAQTPPRKGPQPPLSLPGHFLPTAPTIPSPTRATVHRAPLTLVFQGDPCAAHREQAAAEEPCCSLSSQGGEAETEVLFKPPELQGLGQQGLCRYQRSAVDLRCSAGTRERGMPLGSISLQAEVIVSPSAEASDLALAQLGRWSHPLAVGCCPCHSHLLRARGTKQACVGKKI